MKKLFLLFILCTVAISDKATETDPYLYLYFEISPQNNPQSNNKDFYEQIINTYIPALATDSVKTNILISEYLSSPTPLTRACANVYRNYFSYEELVDLVKLTKSDEYIQATRKSEGIDGKFQNFVNFVCQEIYNDSIIQDLSVEHIPDTFINRYKMYVEQMMSFDINSVVTVMVSYSMAELMMNGMKIEDDQMIIDLSSMSLEEQNDYEKNLIKKLEDNTIELLPKKEKATDYICRNIVYFLILESYEDGITVNDLELIDNPLKQKEILAVMDCSKLNLNELQKETLYDFNSFLKTKGNEIPSVYLREFE